MPVDNKKIYTCINCGDRKAYTAGQIMLAGGCCLNCGALLIETTASLPPVAGAEDEHKLVPPPEANSRGGLARIRRPRGQMLPGDQSETVFVSDGHTFTHEGQANPSAAAVHASSFTPGEWAVLQVVPVKGDIREIEAITQLLNSLGRVAVPISFEIAGTDRRRFLLVRCRKEDAEMVKGRVTVIYGNPDVIELAPDEDPLNYFTATHYIGTVRLQLAKPAGLPLRTYRELGANDTIMPLLSALYDLKNNEVGVTQMIIRGEAPEDWAAPYKQELLAIKRRQQGLLTSGQLMKLFALILGIGFLILGLSMALFQEWILAISGVFLGGAMSFYGAKFFKKSDMEWSEAQEEMVSRKIQMPAYAVEIRIAAGSDGRVRTRRILESIAGAYKVFGLESGNYLDPTPLNHGSGFVPSDIREESPVVSLLGDEEIATLWHLPVEELPDMLASNRVRHVLPDIDLVSDRQNGWYVGQSKKTAGVPVDVWLPRSTITQTHALLMGRTRMGKSNTLEHMIHEVAKDPERTIVVIDPHDDMVEDLLGLMPLHRLNDILYLNFGEEALRPAFNPLDVTLFGGNAEETAAAFQEVAHALYKRYWGPRMEVPFNRAVMSITLANSIREPDSQFTILDVLALLQFEAEQRVAFLEEVLPDDTVLKRTIINYFNFEFGDLQKAFREQVVMPVLSKLRPFESNTHLLSIFGQPRCSFNVINAVLEGKIILIRTGAAKISREYSDFLGSLMLNMIKKAIFLQSNIPFEERRPTTIFVDESQSFSGIDYGEALAEIAKFGGNLVLTTQGSKTVGRSTSSDQVDDPHAFSKIMDNVDTVFVLRISGENALVLSETEFWEEMTPADLINLDKYQAFVRYTKGEKVVGPFKVHLAGPLEKDPAMIDMILRERTRYLVPTPELMETAERSLERISHHFHIEKSWHSPIYSGGEMVGRFDAAEAAEEMANNTPALEGVSLDFVLGTLSELNMSSSGDRNHQDEPPPTDSVEGSINRDWLG
ncbi:DUF87 domain-containing protein [bacterium]|nr:DUF87 domain-containing protein [bacterium]